MSDKKKENKYSKENLPETNINKQIRLRPAMYIGRMNLQGFVEILKGIIRIVFERTDADFVFFRMLAGNKGELLFNNIKQPIDCHWFNWNPHVNTNTNANSNKREEQDINQYSDFLYLQSLNALSKSLVYQLYSARGNYLIYRLFEKGELVNGPKKHKNISAYGMEISFKLDKGIWDKGFVWNPNFVCEQIKSYAYLHKDKTFRIEYKTGGAKCNVVYAFENGLKDKIDIEILKGWGSPYFDTWFDAQINEDIWVEVAFAFREYAIDEKYLKSYVNGNYTPENGTHVTALLKGLTNGVMQYFQKHDLTQKYKISEKGIEENLLACIHLKIDKPTFSGCVKYKLDNSEIIKPIAKYIADILFKKMEKDKLATQKLIGIFEI